MAGIQPATLPPPPPRRRISRPGNSNHSGTSRAACLGKVFGLALRGLDELARVEVALLELGLHGLEGDAVAHVHGVDDVAEALAHLAAVRVAND